MSTNNTDKKYAVSTIGTTYYGRDSKEAKAMVVRFYGNSLVIGFHRPAPVDKQTTGSKYDYKSGTEVYLKPKAAKALARLLLGALKEKATTGNFISAAIPSGQNLVEVGPGEKYGCTEGSICIAVYKELDEAKKTSNMDVFEFKDDSIVKNYNNEAGSYDATSLNIDVDYLIDQLKSYAKSASNAEVHNIKVGVSYDLSRFATRQLEMMTALGIKNTTAYTKPNWDSNNSNSTPTYPASTNELLNELENLG